jgi:cyclophilin family peptidyl-prolyl cis-trans isomerase
VGNPAAPIAPDVAPPAQATQPGAAAWSWYRDPWAWVVAAGAVALVMFSVYKFLPPSEPPPVVTLIDDRKMPHGLGEEFHNSGAKPSANGELGDLLSEMTKDDADPGKESGVLANEELEEQFKAFVKINDQLSAVKKRGSAPGVELSEEELQQARAIRDQYDRASSTLDQALGKAREARPLDPVPQWLTGEVLMIVGGEPEFIGPYLEFAARKELARPRLAGSLALAQLEANRFEDAYRRANSALDQYERDRYVWGVFKQTALANNKFDAVSERLVRAFPTGLPAWAKPLQREAAVLQTKWEAEQQVRRAEALAGDLPRVRLVIEHRRFARDDKGNPLTTIESTGHGEIVLELFENEAPLTVANFIDLVTQKFYDGTSFHLAVPAAAVVGGDPNTRNEDRNRDHDGAGGPGYVIADENKVKTARNHFRGSISMVKIMANKTLQPPGSQFFLSLAPAPEMDGHFTVFGRILEGQEVADKITLGRTTRKFGPFGRPIPGDLLVRAEVLRKRPHEYRAVKAQP